MVASEKDLNDLEAEKRALLEHSLAQKAELEKAINQQACFEKRILEDASQLNDLKYLH